MTRKRKKRLLYEVNKSYLKFYLTLEPSYLAAYPAKSLRWLSHYLNKLNWPKMCGSLQL
jgi:hypothetical protein